MLTARVLAFMQFSGLQELVFQVRSIYLLSSDSKLAWPDLILPFSVPLISSLWQQFLKPWFLCVMAHQWATFNLLEWAATMCRDNAQGATAKAISWKYQEIAIVAAHVRFSQALWRIWVALPLHQMTKYCIRCRTAWIYDVTHQRPVLQWMYTAACDKLLCNFSWALFFLTFFTFQVNLSAFWKHSLSPLGAL